MPSKQQQPQEVDPEVAGQAKGAYNIPSRQICPRHQTYMPNGFCKMCDRESDPDAQAGPNERGMTAEEANYVRRRRGSGQNPDEILQEFRRKKAKQQVKGDSNG